MYPFVRSNGHLEYKTVSWCKRNDPISQMNFTQTNQPSIVAHTAHCVGYMSSQLGVGHCSMPKPTIQNLSGFVG